MTNPGSKEVEPALKACPFCGSTTISCCLDNGTQKWTVLCYDCPISIAAFDRGKVIAAWNTRTPTNSAGAMVDQLWEALKAEVCKSDKAELIVFLTKEKLRRALASFAAASPAPKEEEAQTFKYRDCQLFKERGFHDWRWLGWPLGSIIPVNIDERWCNVCGLRQRPLKGAWANIDYAPTPLAFAFQFKHR